MTQQQLRDLILYHSANSRFHNSQASLIKNHFLEKGFNTDEPDSDFGRMHKHHLKIARKHRQVAESLKKHLTKSL